MAHCVESDECGAKLAVALTIDRPVAVAIVDKSGRNNWNRPSALPEQRSSFVEIENFTIRNGVANFRNEGTGATHTISEINIGPLRAQSADVLDLEFNLISGGQKFQGLGRLSSVLDFWNAAGMLVELEVNNQRQRIQVATRISGGYAPSIDGRISISNLDLGRLIPALDIKGVWGFLQSRSLCSLGDLKLQQVAGGRPRQVEKLYPDDTQLSALMARVLGDAEKRATLGPASAVMLEEWQRRINPGSRPNHAYMVSLADRAVL